MSFCVFCAVTGERTEELMGFNYAAFPCIGVSIHVDAPAARYILDALDFPFMFVSFINVVAAAAHTDQ